MPKPKYQLQKTAFTFIDLFAGIGGFRIAMENLGGMCVFSSEKNRNAQKTYVKNFHEQPYGDITLPAIKDKIPQKFDLLCAGFPCQPFSIAGKQKGFNDTRGTLFFDLCEIISKHQPKFLLLENVSNLVAHNKGKTYQTILKSLNELGYVFPTKPLFVSPYNFGIPALRKRVFFPCVRKDIAKNKSHIIQNFQAEIRQEYTDNIASIDTILDNTISNTLSEFEIRILEMWNDFYLGIDIKKIGFPVWVKYFKSNENLANFPDWKLSVIRKNKKLYQRNKKFIDNWMTKYENLDWCPETHQKLQWNAGKSKSLFHCLIQFRQSGIRIKKADTFATLLANDQPQIIGKYRRRISVNESKKLQSFPNGFILPESDNIATIQLGNSVNVFVVQKIFEIVLRHF